MPIDSSGKTGPSDMTSETPVELIPSTLAWAPEQVPPPGRHSIAALDLCRHGASMKNTSGAYEVRHHDRSACGRAFGPLGLESLLRFCRGLEVKLQGPGMESGDGALLVTTPEGNKKYRANAAVLVGAYVILRHGWSADQVTSCLGKEDASAAFPCAWARRDEPAEDPVMQVGDCWAGIEVARQHCWIDTRFLRDDVRTEKACARHREQLTMYDSAWIVPGSLMVSADPAAVVSNSDLATCKQLCPQDSGVSSPRSYNSRSPYSSTSTEFAHSKSTDDSDSDSDSDCDSAKGKSCRSVRTDGLSEQGHPVGRVREDNFASFLRKSGVRLIVRTEFDDDRDMSRKDGSRGRVFEPYGIAHADIPVVGRSGSAPPQPWYIRQMLKDCEGYMQHEGALAIMIHCKSGFGRSVVLACCLAASRWDVPGSALLGWVRIVRPGAVTTRLQELSLAQLKGRKDVHRLARLPMQGEEDEDHGYGVKVSCRSPCQVQ